MLAMLTAAGIRFPESFQSGASKKKKRKKSKCACLTSYFKRSIKFHYSGIRAITPLCCLKIPTNQKRLNLSPRRLVANVALNFSAAVKLAQLPTHGSAGGAGWAAPASSS